MTMKWTILAAALAAPLAITSLTGLASAQESKALVTFKSLSLQTALKAAQAAMKSCRDAGYQIAVAVVDRSGIEQVTLRDRFAGPHTPDTALRKAWTAVSFRTNSLELGQFIESGEAWAVRNVTNILPVGGGVFIRDGEGSLVGGIGVSGAPGGVLDEICAKDGIAAIEDDIAF